MRQAAAAKKASEAQGSRKGRKPSGKRGTFKFRVSEGLREKLTAAAQSRGRPVSEEIELRLEQSFLEEQLLGARHNFAVARLAAQALSVVEDAFQRSWVDSDVVKQAGRAAVTAALEISFGKRLEPSAPPEDLERQEKAEAIGTRAAYTADAENAINDVGGALRDEIDEIRSHTRR